MKTRALLLSFLLVLLSVGQLGAATYSYSIDRFEISGNLPRSAYDEFDDGELFPWSVSDGTASESGGVVSLSTPGDVMATYDIGGLVIEEERSSIWTNSSTFSVRGGEGDFTATSTWDPVVPIQNQFYGMQLLSYYGDGSKEDISLNLLNFDATLANALGIEPGLNVWFFLRDDSLEFYPIDHGDITGDILFQMAFNDTSNEVNGTFSVDGGLTFETFSSSVTSNIDSANDVYWMMEAADLEVVPIPGAVWLLGSGFIGLLGLRKKFKK